MMNNQSISKVEIALLPANERILVDRGANLLSVIRNIDEDIESACNGNGTCGKCRIKIISGDAGEIQKEEKAHLKAGDISFGIRLACCVNIIAPLTIEIQNGVDSNNVIMDSGLIPNFNLNPVISKRFVELPKPTLENNVDDLKRIADMLNPGETINLQLTSLRRLGSIVREADFMVTLVFNENSLVGIESGDTTGLCYGLAIDIGTTTVVVALVDIKAGIEIATRSMLNPQTAYGLDVLSRIHYIRENPNGLSKLSELLQNGINQLVCDLCEGMGINGENIYEAVIAGNTVMQHIYMGIDPSAIGESPFVPVLSSRAHFLASDIKLSISDFGMVYCLPVVSAYMGGDIVAGLIVIDCEATNENSLLVDIGTNGEIVLGSKDGLLGCSCAAGPAFEGMNIECGMRAADGAIESVRIDETLKIGIIGGTEATGICGSGLIDIVAELRRIGLIDQTGRLAKIGVDEKTSSWRSRLKNDERGNRFILFSCDESADIKAEHLESEDMTGYGERRMHGETRNDEVWVSQKDIRQLQLAKGAITSGILALTGQAKVALKDVDRIYIAGAFGCHASLENLAYLGLFPHEFLEKVKLIGNSSKIGATMCLLSKEKRTLSERIAASVEYIELSCAMGYDRIFADCLTFPSNE